MWIGIGIGRLLIRLHHLKKGFPCLSLSTSLLTSLTSPQSPPEQLYFCPKRVEMWCCWGRWGAPYQQSAGAAHLEVKPACTGRAQTDVLLLARELTEALKKLPAGDEPLARICFLLFHSSYAFLTFDYRWTDAWFPSLSLSSCSDVLWQRLETLSYDSIMISAICGLRVLGGNTTSPRFHLWYSETWHKGTAGHCCLLTARWGHANVGFLGWSCQRDDDC